MRTNTMMNTETSLNIKELCSRKLWELLILDSPTQANRSIKKSLEQELLTRRHYVAELEQWKQLLH